MITEDFIDQLERELSAASQRRVRLAAARVPRPPVAAAAAVLATLVVCVAVALPLLQARSRPGAADHSRSAPAAPAGARGLVSELAILRRPQTARDRTFPADTVRIFNSLPQRKRIVPSLTRLAASVRTGSGEARVYVIVLESTVPGSYLPGLEYEAWAITIRGAGANATAGLTAQELSQQAPGVPAVGLAVSENRVIQGVDVVASENGVNQSLVPDGVARVRWVFNGRSPDGKQLRPPVTIYPTVHDNIALAPLVHDQGTLATANWYDANGRAIAATNLFVPTYTHQYPPNRMITGGGPGELLNLAGTDFRQIALQISADVPYPPGYASWRDSVISAEYQLQRGACPPGAPRGCTPKIPAGALHGAFAASAFCAWVLDWRHNTMSGRHAVAARDARVISGALRWKAVTAWDPHPSMSVPGDMGTTHPSTFGWMIPFIQAVRAGDVAHVDQAIVTDADFGGQFALWVNTGMGLNLRLGLVGRPLLTYLQRHGS